MFIVNFQRSATNCCRSFAKHNYIKQKNAKKQASKQYMTKGVQKENFKISK